MTSKKELKRMLAEAEASEDELLRNLNTYSGTPRPIVNEGQAKVSASDAYGLMVAIDLYGAGEISAGRLREALGEWLTGRRVWKKEDFGLSNWPKKPEKAASWSQVDEVTAFAMPFGAIHACLRCGCLVAGGLTTCLRCAYTGTEDGPRLYEAKGPQ